MDASAQLSASGAACRLSQPWRSEEVISSADVYQQRLTSDLDRARITIDLESYIIDTSSFATAVLEALARAFRRGVRVRLLMDGAGAIEWLDQRLHREFPVRWRVYHPLPWTVVGGALPGQTQTARWLLALRRINRRNHRKTCVIDGRIGWIGSCNLDERSSEAAHGVNAWRETVARVEGPDLHWLSCAFEASWQRGWRPRHRVLLPVQPRRARLEALPAQARVRLNATFRQRRDGWRRLLVRFGGVRQRLWITTPYFVPGDDLLRALERARHRGADVRLLLPAHNDMRFMTWIAGLYVERLQRCGVRLFAYHGMIHAKTAVLDQRALAGSSNLNSRSLRSDLEADVWLEQPASVAALAEVFSNDCIRAVELPPGTRPAWWMRVLGRLVLTARRWL